MIVAGTPVAQSSAASETIVLVGSLASDSSMWSEQMSKLALDHRVICIDLPGHGVSPLPLASYSVEEAAEASWAFLSTSAVETVHLVGLSLGGSVVMAMALARPEKVKSLTVMCTTARHPQPELMMERGRLAKAEGMEAVAGSTLSRWFTNEYFQTSPARVARAREMILRTPTDAYFFGCQAVASFDVRDALSRIMVPTLVVAGAFDTSTPPTELRLISGEISSSQYVELPSGHHPQSEFASTVTTLIYEHVSHSKELGQ